jgi:hypothetical protein
MAYFAANTNRGRLSSDLGGYVRPTLEEMIMRTFGTFLAVAIFAGAAGCGGGSGGSSYTSPTGRSAANGGQCPGSSSGQTCTGEQAYMDCAMKACGTQYKTCFGNNYAKGDFTGGTCADFIACEMNCPCDATKATCEGTCTAGLATATGATCMTCLTTLSTCVTGAACTQPVCTTGTTTTTTTSTGTNCAALQTCCGKMADATIKAACQSAITSAGGDDATCALILPSLQTYCP